MRHLILDTETTGLDPKLGHRVIEIAAVEVVDRRLTGRSVHFYVNPEREIDGGATDVHGLTWEMLRDKPRFADIAGEFIDFARGARWVIHNAAFDLAFLDAELERLQLESASPSSIRWRSPASSSRARRTASMPSASGLQSPTRIARCTAHCSTRASSPRFTWR
jgi:DNA polymerase III epsilon subunit